SNDVAGLPEDRGIRMLRPSDQQVAGRLHRRRIAGVEKLQVVHFFQVESQTAFGTVNLEPIAIAASSSVAAGFEAAQAAVAKTRHHLHSVIYVPVRHK